MSSYQYYVVDAFTTTRFGGNPAGVVLCLDEPSNDSCIKIAKELAQPAVAFVTHPSILSPSFATSSTSQLPLIKWFSASGNQIPLCGHATMAASILLLTHLFPSLHSLTYIFPTRAVKDGVATEGTSKITVTKEEDGRVGIFLPAASALTDIPKEEVEETKRALQEALHVEDEDLIKIGRTVLPDPSIFFLLVHLAASVDLAAIDVVTAAFKALPDRGVYVTSQWPESAPPEQKKTFRSRVFFPNFGIDEDHVCGSAHTLLAGYWSETVPSLATATPSRLPSPDLTTSESWLALEGDQVSQRRGALGILWNGEFGPEKGIVCLLGRGKVMMKGEIYLD